MALNIDVNTGSDRVDHGSDASLDNLDPFTYLTWIQPTVAFISASRLFSKNAITNVALVQEGGGLQYFRDRDTDTSYITDTLMTLNAWNLVAIVFNSSGGENEIVNIYSGSLTAAATEASSYSTQDDGSGALASDAGGSWIVGNRSAFDRSMASDIAIVAIINRALSLSEIIAWQWQPRVVADTVLFSHYGFNGTTTAFDLSGNGNDGTASGATIAAHVPLGPPFGFDDESSFEPGPVGFPVLWHPMFKHQHSLAR